MSRLDDKDDRAEVIIALDGQGLNGNWTMSVNVFDDVSRMGGSTVFVECLGWPLPIHRTKRRRQCTVPHGHLYLFALFSAWHAVSSTQ